MVHSFADARKEQVTTKAGRICFDNQGGLHERCPGALYNV
jgi:hypothetical protein